MEEDILNYLYQLSCFVGHPVLENSDKRVQNSFPKQVPLKLENATYKQTSVFKIPLDLKLLK